MRETVHARLLARLVALIVAVIVAGCGGAGGPAASAPGAADSLGSLQVVATRETVAAASLPGSTTAVRLSVLDTGVTSTSEFPAGSSTVSITLSGVPVGERTVLAEVLAGSEVILSGRSTAMVRPSASTRVTIALTAPAPAVLSVTAVDPPGGPSAGGSVTITGTGFATSGAVTVTFGGVPATGVSVVDSSKLTCTSPPGAAQAVDVEVINPDQRSAQLAAAYSYYVDTPVIVTVTGTGVPGFSGDGGPATAAQIDFPWDVQVDASGHVFFVDTDNRRIRRIDAETGLISTIAGTGATDATGDGGPATAAAVNPVALDFGPDGDLYVLDAGGAGGRLLRKISSSTGDISLVKDLTGTSVRLLGFVMDNSLNAYLAHWFGPAKVYKMDAGGNVTVVTTGLSAVRSVALSPDESVLYASNQNGFDIAAEGHKVKRITLPGGALADFAGTGVQGFFGDGGPASAARLDTPWFVSTNSAGDVFLCDRGNNRIRVVDAGTGFIDTVVGDGTAVTGATAALPRGDGGPPLKAQIQPIAMCEWQGDLYFSETDFNKVRRVTTAPNPTGVSPSSGPAGSVVTVTGTNFRPGARVSFGGVPATGVRVVSLTQLVCTVPSGVTGPMPVAVVVQNQGTNKTALAQAFTVVP